MSRASVARKLGVNRSQVTDWLGAHRRPSFQHAMRIESLFGIPHELWFPDESPAKSGVALPATDSDPRIASSDK